MLQRRLYRLSLTIILVLSLLVPSSSGSASSSQLDLAAIDAFLSEVTTANRIPGLAVGIVQDDEVVFLKGYGEAAPGEPVTPQTQFYIGSLTKSFTALAAMQLVEQGKLSLDAPVQQYLPWFQVADPQASAAITVRQLLNHTSGLSETGDPNANAYTSSLEEQARLLKDSRPIAPPGTRFEYYNQNYRVVGLLIEQVSGQSYADYVREHIFQPLGMAGTTADPTQAARLAQGHSRVFGFPFPRSQRFIPGSLPSGYIISTAEDMAAYLRAQLNNQQLDGSSLLDPQYLEPMRVLPDGIDSGYGMGWLVMDEGRMLAHGGTVDFFQAFQVIYLDKKLGLIILCNQNGMENMLFENGAVRDGLLKLLNGEPAQQVSYAWVGWLLLVLAAADLLNHARLFRALPGWARNAAAHTVHHPWVTVIIGIGVPLLIIFGLPVLAKAIRGGSLSWTEPLRLMPDLTVWLLLGMSLNLIRGLLKAMALLRR